VNSKLTLSAFVVFYGPPAYAVLCIKARATRNVVAVVSVSNGAPRCSQDMWGNVWICSRGTRRDPLLEGSNREPAQNERESLPVLPCYQLRTLYSARDYRASSSEYLRAIVSEVRRRALNAAATQGFWRLVRSTNGREGSTLDICSPSLTRKRMGVLTGSSTFEPLARKAL
jgi:hypothetical protein